MKKISDILTSKKTYLDKSTLTSGDRYLITLRNIKTGVYVKFQFNDNYLNDSNINDFVYCLIQDCYAYENARNLEDFVNNFGYDSIYDIRAIKAYKGCEKQAERLHKLLTAEEIEECEKILEEIGY